MILEQMRKTELFSSSEQTIIEYILKHDEFMNMTIDQLAKETYTSNSTIIRLCRKLGFSGYREFKVNYIRENESTKYISHLVDFDKPFKNLENGNEIVQNMASLYRESIDICLQRLDGNMMIKVSNAIRNSTRVFIFASGDTMITVKAFINKLIKINIYPILASQYQEAIANAYNVTSDDCVLFISYSLKSNDYQEIMNIIPYETKTIVITANQESAVAIHSTYSVYISKKESHEKIATFYSQFVFEFILNIIYSILFANDYQKNSQHKSCIDYNQRMTGKVHKK